MSLRSNLSDHLVTVLNVICGRFLREGEEIDNPGFLTQRYDKRCQVVPASRPWETGWKSRIQGYGLLPCIHEPELGTGIMTDEILQPGPDQVKAFFVHGGNPAVVVPDQQKVVRAFKSLELLVTIDPYMTPTAKLSHYVLPTRLQYERPDLPLWMMEQTPYPFYNESFTRYTPAVAKTPPGSEISTDAEIFWGIAKRLGVTTTYLGVPLDMTKPPTPDDMLAITARHSVVPLEEIKKHPMGIVYEDGGPQIAFPAEPGANARFSLAPYDIVAELKDVAAEKWLQEISVSDGSRATHRMTCRRIRHQHNSQQRTLPSSRKRLPYNVAWVNPDDLADMGVKSGDMIRVSSEVTTIEIKAEADDSLRRGVIAIPYGFGALPDEANYEEYGVTPNLLISTDRHLEPINAMPRMSAFPVAISPADRRNSPVDQPVAARA
jgi:anaerobic selenocysteine-containing dehydrogenase